MPDTATRTQGLTRPITLVEGWERLPGDSGEWTEGQRLGPYRLLRRLGRGGMGVVWLAEQLEPLHREVAIKLLPRERHNALSEIYFEIERQALAQLTHPAIAQIHDAGCLPDGALFFAMEYVRGLPLDAHVEATRPDERAIAGLLCEICRGVHHAHQRGLIHRDLKPQNILVEVVDGHARPKIIDFGIAIGTRPGEAAVDEAGHVIGTPAYMSPEQRDPGRTGIDARSDVYALGAILAELLCRAPGRTLDPSEIDSGVRRRSLALSLGRTAPRDPGAGVDAQSILALAARLRGARRELRAIALKALAEDRERRYDSAAAMADDLAAWLAHRPVRALGDNRSHVLACFVRRHALASAAGALVAVALMAGALLALHGMNRAREAQALAERRRDEGERLIQYMLGDFADKLRPINRLDLLDGIGQQALDYLTTQAASADPRGALARARALRTLGEVQVTRQQFDLADRSLSEADAVLGPWLASRGHDAAEHAFEAAQVAFWRGAIAYRRQQLEHAGVYWQRYRELAERFAELAPQDARAPMEIASSLQNLGTLAEAEGRLEQALSSIEQAIAIRMRHARGPADPLAIATANSLSWKARVLGQIGRHREARSAILEAIARVHAARAAADDNVLLQHETNLRWILGWTEHQLGNDPEARLQLQSALLLAQQDVANDPSKPRRWAMLARIAFALARVAPADRSAALWLDQGERALVRIDAADLTAREYLLLQGRRCIAGLAVTPARYAPDCAANVWPRLSRAADPAPADYDQLFESAHLALALERAGPDATERRALELLRSRLRALPAAQHQSIEYLLALRALSERLEPGGTEVAWIDRRLADMRANAVEEPTNAD